MFFFLIMMGLVAHMRLQVSIRGMGHAARITDSGERIAHSADAEWGICDCHAACWKCHAARRSNAESLPSWMQKNGVSVLCLLLLALCLIMDQSRDVLSHILLFCHKRVMLLISRALELWFLS